MKKYFILLFLFLFCCYTPQIPTHVLKEIEMEDDNLCNLEGLNYYSKYYKFAEKSRDVYWRCRLRIIDQRIKGEFDTYGYSELYKNEFKKMRRVIINRLKDEQEKLVDEIFNTLDERQHNYCLVLKDQTHLDPENPYTYEDCINDLKYLRDEEYEKYKIQKTNEEILKDFYEEEEKEPLNKIKKVNKECIKYAVDEEKLKLCENSIDEIRECEEGIFNKLKDRRRDDKIFCLEESVIKYPDSLSVYQGEGAFSGPKINKNELIDLRNKFYEKCYDDRVLKIDGYKKHLENECKVKSLAIIDKID